MLAYHRGIIINYFNEHVGYGVVSDGSRRIDVMNAGAINHADRQPATRVIYTYPGNGQQDIPREWNGGEIPDPLPETDSPVGYPASLHIAHPISSFASEMAPFDWGSRQPLMPDDSWSVALAELRDAEGNIMIEPKNWTTSLSGSGYNPKACGGTEVAEKTPPT